MSKVISFSISDRYLDKIRSLYPHLTDNLAAKQFITDGLDSSLSSSLDDSLDGILDDGIKTLIESWVDGLLDERLDDAVKKSVTSLSERMARLEERLDGSLDERLDDMELLLRMQREASIANPPIEGGNGDNPDLPPSPDAIETVPGETDSLFKLALKLDRLDEQASIDAIESQLKLDDNEENYSTLETALEAIETVTGDTSPINDAVEGEDEDRPAIENENRETSPTIETGEGMNAAQAYRYLAQKKVEVSERTLSNWVNRKGIPMTDKGDQVSEYLILRDGRYFPDQG